MRGGRDRPGLFDNHAYASKAYCLLKHVHKKYTFSRFYLIRECHKSQNNQTRYSQLNLICLSIC